MTAPRRILPGQTCLVTRRVMRQRFLLKPTPVCRQIVEYCFARANQIYPGIQLHALQVLFDHFHVELTDTNCTLPLFMAWIDREMARALNVYHDRSDSLWCGGSYSCQVLDDRATVRSKAVYLFTNAVRHGLVRDYRQWPGISSTPRDWLRKKPKVVKRPRVYFSQRDPKLASVELRFVPPPQLADDVEQAVREMEQDIEARQSWLREQARLQGKSFLGADRAMKQSPFDVARTKHVKGKLKPTFAAATPEGRQRAQEERKSFLGAHREAFEKMRAGEPCVFPAGSYLWPRRCAVPCAPLSSARVAMDSS